MMFERSIRKWYQFCHETIQFGEFKTPPNKAHDKILWYIDYKANATVYADVYVSYSKC